MKKILTAVFLMLCLCISGCQSDEVVIIDDAQTQKAPLRMIKVDGKLYYDSGRVSNLMKRCGTMDGNLKKIGESDEIPKNDNECNFDGARGYQNATSITKQVPIDGNWVIFKLFDDPELDMDIYKYCFYLKGRLPNAESDSELAVLTDDKDYDFEKWADTILQSKYNPDEKQYKATFKALDSDDKWGLSLYTKDVSKAGLTLCCEQFGGSPTGELQTGESFFLEEYKWGKWIKVSVKQPGNYAWHSVAYKIPQNEITELEVDWEWLYGELPAGSYRVGKEFMDFRKPGDFDKEIYYTQFIIEQ